MKKTIISLLLLLLLATAAKGTQWEQDQRDSRIYHFSNFKYNNAWVIDNWNMVHAFGGAFMYTAFYSNTQHRGKAFLYSSICSVAWEITDGFKPLYYTEDKAWGSVPWIRHLTHADGFSYSDVVIDVVGMSAGLILSLRHNPPIPHEHWSLLTTPNGVRFIYTF